MEMLLIMRMDHHIRAETVNDNTDQMVFPFQCNLPVFAAVHAKGLSGKCGKIKVLEVLSAKTALLRHPDLLHLVNAVMLDLPGSLFIADHIVIFVIPCQSPGRNNVFGTTFFLYKFLSDSPLAILKSDLPVILNSLMDSIYI